jgi:drug/metabolite transporter (DMT)-like permease
MIYVIAAALSITCLSLIMRYATLHTKTLWGVILGNYLTAASIMLGMVVGDGSWVISPFTLGLGAVTGLTYAAGMYLNLTLMRKRGAAIASSMIQLSVLIPISVSVFFYGETLGSLQLLGIALAVASLPLLASKPMQKLELDREVIPMIILTIIVVGFSQLSSKILVQAGLESQNAFFLLTIFTSAALLVSPLALRNRESIVGRDGLFGLGVGIFNVASNRFLLLALTTLPGAIVFPVSSAGSLLLVTISAIVLFKEKVSRVNLVGILLTLAAVVLINA